MFHNHKTVLEPCLNDQNMGKVTDSLSSCLVFQYVHESDFSCWAQGVKVETESRKYVGDRFESVYCIDDNALHQVGGQ